MTAHSGSGRRVSWRRLGYQGVARASPCRLAFHSDRCANPSTSSAGGLHHIMTIQGEGQSADCRHSLRFVDGYSLAAFEREEPGHANHCQSYCQTLKPHAETGRESGSQSSFKLKARRPAAHVRHLANNNNKKACSGRAVTASGKLDRSPSTGHHITLCSAANSLELRSEQLSLDGSGINEPLFQDCG